MNWLLIAIIAHFIFALVFVIDKFLLSKTALRPIAYAFYVGLLGGFALLLIPFGFSVPPAGQIMASFIAGFLFVLAILFFYKTIQIGEISRITPIVGGAVPLFTLILTYSFLGERLAISQLVAFFLLVLGGIIMFWPRKEKIISKVVKAPLAKKLTLAIIAALFFAGSFVLTKFIFTEQSFINGFIWIRMGGFLGAWLLFFWPGSRQIIFKTTKIIKVKSVGLLISNKTLSALAFILLNYAIFLGSVTLVNSLQGVQYVFLLIVALFLSKKFPQILKEQIGQGAILQKIIAILFIGLGLGILVF
jgi:drug/metabolite transporter (DMT)-like permease